MADFDKLVAEAHKRALKVIVDLVPNHTSDQHPWFQESKQGPTSAKRDWYVWRDAAADGGVPNNWPSYFGGPAWTLDPASGQYFLHQFLPEQPDLNFRNPKVIEAMLDAMRFWLKRDIDGFRVDVIWLLVEAADFGDEPENRHWHKNLIDRARTIHTKIEDQPETHEVIQKMRKVLDQFSSPGFERMMIGEIYLPYYQLITYYGTKEKPECHLPFNFHLITDALDNWNAATVRKVVDEYMAILPAGESANWVLGNHDQFRFGSRIGSEQARIATMLLLTLPGSPTWYYGDEIGMVNGVIPPNKIVDPRGLRQPEVISEQRDPERTPMQWNDTAYSGFSTVDTWLPVNADSVERNVQMQEQQKDSMLNLVKHLLRLRKEHQALRSGTYASINSDAGIFAYSRESADQKITVYLNFTNETRVIDCENGENSKGSKGEVLASTTMQVSKVVAAQTLKPFEGLILLNS